MLEPARPGRGPTLDDNFFLREELHGISALSVQISEEAVARAAEGEERHRRGNGDVHPNVADLRLVTELSRVRAARCKQARLIAVRPAVHERNGFVDRVDVMGRQHGAKNFRCRELAGERQTIDHSGTDEIPAAVRGALELPAIRKSTTALGHSLIDRLHDACAALRRDERLHLYSLVEAEPDDARLGSVANGFEEGIVRAANRNRERGREAALSGASKR